MTDFDEAMERLFASKPERRTPPAWDAVLWQTFQGLVAVIQVLVLLLVGFPIWLLLPAIIIYAGLQIFKKFTNEEDDYDDA